MRLYLLALLLALASLSASAAGGHDWAALDHKGREVVVLMYDQGRSDGCGLAAAMASRALFADKETQTYQHARLLESCPRRVAWEGENLTSIVRSIDDAYRTAGAARLPIAVMLKMSIEAHLRGEKAIPRNELQEWIKAGATIPAK